MTGDAPGMVDQLRDDPALLITYGYPTICGLAILVALFTMALTGFDWFSALLIPFAAISMAWWCGWDVRAKHWWRRYRNRG